MRYHGKALIIGYLRKGGVEASENHRELTERIGKKFKVLKRIMPSLMAVVLTGLLIGCSETEVAKVEKTEKPEKPTTMDRAVFAWEGVDKDGLEIIEKYDINTVLLDYNHSKDIKKLRSFNTTILAGDSSWDADDLKKVVEEVAELKADGVVFDIESDYAALASNLEELDVELENENTENTDIPVYVCIPFWLDTQAGGEVLLERIIKATDGMFVMNYYRSDEMSQVECEYSMAKVYGKQNWTIYELQPVGMYDLKDYNTYHNQGLAAVEENYRKMFWDTEVGLAFHTLEMNIGVRHH